MQPPDGPPVWAALNFLPLGDTAAYLVYDLMKRRAHGYLDKSGMPDLSAKRKDLGSLRSFRAH